MYLKLPWETYICAYCWVNTTGRIMETIHSEEKQHRFSDWKVDNGAIVSLHTGDNSPTAEELHVKTKISKQSWCFLLGIGCCQGFRWATPVSMQETKQDILVKGLLSVIMLIFYATLELLKTQGCIRSTPKENKWLGFCLKWNVIMRSYQN